MVEPKSLVGALGGGELLAVLFGAFYEHCYDTMERSRFRGERKSGESESTDQARLAENTLPYLTLELHADTNHPSSPIHLPS